MWDELIFSAAMAHYLTSLYRSSLRHSAGTAEAVSHYLWGLISHGIVVLGQTASILTVRATGTIDYVIWRFGSIDMLTMPRCVDIIMGYRYKLAKISGYLYHNSQLCYTKETLKAHGLLKVTDSEGKEFLAYHSIHWLPSTREDLAILGKLAGEHVDACPERAYSSPAAVCDRVLGGATLSIGDALDELESAPQGNGACADSNQLDNSMT